MIKDNDLILIRVLQNEWQMLQSSAETLRQSVEKCTAIGAKKEYSTEQKTHGEQKLLTRFCFQKRLVKSHPPSEVNINL